MTSVRDVVVFIWFYIFTVPLTLVLYKLSKYVLLNDFKEWWISIIWVLSAPVTIGALYFFKKEG